MTEIYLVVGKKRLFLRTRNFSISLTMSRFIRMHSRNLALEERGLISFDLVLTKAHLLMVMKIPSLSICQLVKAANFDE